MATSLSFNEKGSTAHSWVIVNDDSSTENESERTLKEFFVQFYFQCVMSSNTQDLEEKFELLLLKSYDAKQYSRIDFLQYIIKMCLQNRDIKSGKGLTKTTYMMLNTMAYYCYEKKILPSNTILKILKGFVTNKYNEHTKTYDHPYGSWKDIKYFLEYFCNDTIYKYVTVSKLCIVNEIIQNIYIPQMINDRKNMSLNKPISLCGKWLPRESGQFKQLSRKIANQYHKEVYRLTESNVKIYKQYRQLISNFNNYLDTTQIHMAGKTWDKINFENVTSKTLFLNKESFQNLKEIDEDHRHICKTNYSQFVSSREKNGNYLKNDNTVMPHVLVRNAIKNFSIQENGTTSILNMQWNGLMKTLENSSFTKDGYFYPCIDVSPSMMIHNGVPLHCAIGLGLACVDLYKHNRAFTFSSEPQWIKYENTENFVDRVYKTMNSSWGSTTNIHKLFKKILETSLQNNHENERLPQSEIDKICLIIFSDMQFDCHETENEDELFEVIRREYKSAGYDNIPFLIFWNLRSTNTFPTIEKTKNMIQLSGNSVCLLEIFLKTSLEDFKKLENWDMLKQILDNRRYILS